MQDGASDLLDSGGVPARLELLEESVADLSASLSAELQRLSVGVQFLLDDEPRNRRLLAELRASPEYEAPFLTPDPLLSVLIPTFDRVESLTTRSIPSVLAQSHENIEVVVVGDHASQRLAEAVMEIDDPRVRFSNLTYNGPYEDDPLARWSASGTPPLNQGLKLARGHWLAALGDDDQMPPGHLATLLEFAQRRRVELVYGKMRITDHDGTVHLTGSFPPRLGQINLQTSLWHAGLRFFEFELSQAAMRVPNDWALIRRMMRAGVTMAQTEDTAVDWVPSRRARAVEAPRTVDRSREQRRRIAELEDRVAQLERERDRLSAQVIQGARDTRVAEAEFESRLAAIQQSRAWKLTAPLRLMGGRPDSEG